MFLFGVDVAMDTNIITFLACICFIFIFGRIFILPLKKILKLILNSILGGVFIYIINLIGATFGFHIGLNLFTSILIRIIRITRSNLFNCCEITNWIARNEVQ
jgi:inhibitor of the pro-sigma K processing machinery